MMKAIAQRVSLSLRDPDAGYGAKVSPGDLPTVRGTIIDRAPAWDGKMDYLMKLDKPLPSGFRAMDGYLVEEADIDPISYLLLTPRPDVTNNYDPPPDYIGECISKHELAMVGVSLIRKPVKLPRKITMDHIPGKFPGLCSGQLKALDGK